MEGWVSKKRTTVPPYVYQRRYMRLEEGSHEIAYYKQPSDMASRGAIELYSLRRVFPTAPADLGTSKLAKTNAAFAVSLQTDSRTFHFIYDSLEERDLWLVSGGSRWGHCTVGRVEGGRSHPDVDAPCTRAAPVTRRDSTHGSSGAREHAGVMP